MPINNNYLSHKPRLPPFRWFGVKFTQYALMKADENGGKRGLWLKFLDMLGLGFAC